MAPVSANEKNGMRLTFVGPPGSGKGTQAKIICGRWRIPQISTGDMLRSAKAQGRLPQDLIQKMDSGGLVPDEMVIAMIDERTQGLDCAPGYLLDGFPRTVPQAEALDEMLRRRDCGLDVALALEVPPELLIERAVLRRTDRKSGLIYHLKYNPPPADADLEQRKDDQERVVMDRVNTYHRMTADLLPYYEKQGILRRVNGVGLVEEVTARIMEALKTL